MNMSMRHMHCREQAVIGDDQMQCNIVPKAY